MDEYKCETCGATFATQEELDDHECEGDEMDEMEPDEEEVM